MRSTLSAKLVSTLLLLIILSSYVVCPMICCGGEPSPDPDTQVSALHNVQDDDACPHCPDGFTPDEHDHVCVSCPCHAPLTSIFIQPVYAPTITCFTASDPFHYLPDVFLPKFVPPQIQA